MSPAMGVSLKTLPSLEEVKASNRDRDVPLEAAWIWGENDELGRLNLLTPERILHAKTTEMVDGHCVSLKCGMQAWSEHGIVGRGVLLDYHRWKTEVRKEPYDAFTSHAIHLEDLEAVASYQNVEFQCGDILLVRSGYTATYYEYEKSAPERLAEAGTHKPNLAGLAQTEEIKTWLHDRYFSAVAGDAPSFECWPTTQKWHLHEYLLACWGVPIGEMFDLEALAVQCLKRKRWSFFFVSTPLNSPGGVASLANAMAIF
ncbi:hypothetical protein FLONG3_3572 [Fusarium longipes]|uniref:Cyclase n=1 Tax=Fusarium longipes TaxID=694270 RepID=A0A395T167_9HYPO|nr:hypothetical protein FLONG3_3572 [Fusarium longipes]